MLWTGQLTSILKTECGESEDRRINISAPSEKQKEKNIADLSVGYPRIVANQNNCCLAR
jgi:hypothetical protein